MSRKKPILQSDHNLETCQRVLTANSEIQLKRRFEKWCVKKNMPRNDSKIMVSLKRKHQDIGENARFQWRGHGVEQERIERASKRTKGPLASPKSELLTQKDHLILIPVLSHSGSY